MLPIDLVLVRHGQSEGNLAKRQSEGGDHSAFTPEFRKRHTSSFRLTDKGMQQAERAGQVLRDEFYKDTYGFDRFYVSEYARAQETAALLRLPDASWRLDSYLSERDWSDLSTMPDDERQQKFGEALEMQDVEPFFWAPPNGESLHHLCLRIDRVLNTLHRESSDKRVVLVCHGEVMWAFRIRLERLSKQRFKELHFSENPQHKIHNCQIIHYTRRDPTSGSLASHANWVRHIRTGEPSQYGAWQDIVRATYSNEDLLAMVEQIPRTVT
jgi:NAD+ kinase